MYIFIIISVIALAGIVLLISKRKATRPTHAGGIVYKEAGGQHLYLLVSSSRIKYKWVLPKGRIEKQESPEITALREVQEEAGIQANIIRHAGTVTYTKKGERITVQYFIMEFEKLLNHNNEGRQVAWLNKKDAIKRLTNKHVISIIEGL